MSDDKMEAYIDACFCALQEEHAFAGESFHKGLSIGFQAGYQAGYQARDADYLHAAELLYRHNLWRRGDDTHEMANPKELGIAIDMAIQALRNATPTTTAPQNKRPASLRIRLHE